MRRFSEQLRDWLSRAELLARGAEWRRFEAVRQLEAGRPWEARYQALAIVDELGHSPVALALWADAAEAMFLDDEALTALELLSQRVPFRADIWWRRAAAEARTGQNPMPSLERAAELGHPVEAADQARLWLAALDLDRGDPERSERWLSQLSLKAYQGREARLLQVAIELSRRVVNRGALARAESLGADLVPELLDSRGWLIRGQLLSALGRADAWQPLMRALLLDAPGADQAVAEFVLKHPAEVERFRDVIAELGLSAAPRFRAVLALAEKDTPKAIVALREAAASLDDPEVLGQLIELAIAAEDSATLLEGLRLSEQRGLTVSSSLLSFARALAEPDPKLKLDLLDQAGPETAAWANQLRQQIYRAWLPNKAPAQWAMIVSEFEHFIRELGLLHEVFAVEGIVADLKRPLRVVIAGEFNAGKSSFINALLGESVAPVGVIPTTATENVLSWAPDRVVRIAFKDPENHPERTVPLSEAAAVLKALDQRQVERVHLYAPIHRLRDVELVDTPGLNAPDPTHGQAAEQALRAAQVVVWVIDGTQPLKASEGAWASQLRERGVPVIVLVNKCDRLGGVQSEATASVLSYVSEGLKALGVPLQAPPIPVCTRAALESPGDEDALRACGWLDCERMLDEVVVGRRHPLKELSLRRSALATMRRIRSAAQAVLESSERRAEAREQQLHEFANLEAEVEDALTQLATAEGAALEGTSPPNWFVEPLREPIQRLQSDLKPALRVARDRSIVRFMRKRVRAALSASVTKVLLDHFNVASAIRPEIERVLEPRLAASAGAVLSSMLVNAPIEREFRGLHANGGADGREAILRQLLQALPELALEELQETTRACRAALVVEPRPFILDRLHAFGVVVEASLDAASLGDSVVNGAGEENASESLNARPLRDV